MKNFFKARVAPLFGIIALVAVIGFSMAACGGDDDDDGGGGGGGGGGLAWPTGFTYTPGNTGSLTGTWTATGIGNVTFFDGSYPFVTVGGAMNMLDLIKVEGKKITLEGDVVLCTDYTLDLTASPATLTLTGGDSSKFSDYLDVALTKN